MASSANPSIVGAGVTFTATVIGNAPSGSVTFTDGGTIVASCGAVVLTGSGNTRTALCSTAALTAGTHSIAASYSGDGANSASSSAALTAGRQQNRGHNQRRELGESIDRRRQRHLHRDGQRQRSNRNREFH